eukprot:gnl/Trimastix_PCT/2845.p1 GENE.gnl/Trimastix_PCT/2845~~gnl/Trimastix_PCT/2845.p1  ORF type:complete len:447 (+),score=91.95 gnl/Trimastix_PCT/2845:78-1418(+)
MIRRTNATQLLSEALAQDESGNHKDALYHYFSCVENLVSHLRVSSSVEESRGHCYFLQQCLDRIKVLVENPDISQFQRQNWLIEQHVEQKNQQLYLRMQQSYAAGDTTKRRTMHLAYMRQYMENVTLARQRQQELRRAQVQAAPLRISHNFFQRLRSKIAPAPHPSVPSAPVPAAASTFRPMAAKPPTPATAEAPWASIEERILSMASTPGEVLFELCNEFARDLPDIAMPTVASDAAPCIDASQVVADVLSLQARLVSTLKASFPGADLERAMHRAIFKHPVLGPRVQALFQAKHAHSDRKYAAQLDLYAAAVPSQFGVAKELSLGQGEGYAPAIARLATISTLPAPLDKVDCLTETFDAITSCLTQHNVPSEHRCADDILATFMFVLVRAQSPSLHAQADLMWSFLDDPNGPAAYGLCQLQASLDYVTHHFSGGQSIQDGEPVG